MNIGETEGEERNIYFFLFGLEVNNGFYHAVIPQTCVPEMARFLCKLDQEVGWDAIAEMELQQLDFHLPGVTSLAHGTKPLVRFVSDVQSRRIAGGLVRATFDLVLSPDVN